MSAVKVLAAVRQADPSAFDRSEPQLLEAARIHAIGDLQRVVGFWASRSITLTTCEATMPPTRGGAYTPPRRTWGWSVSTATSTPRPAKRS